MKKTSLAIFAVLILCVVTLAGCAKADTATLADCYNLYSQVKQDYSQSSNYLFSVEKNTIDLHSVHAYNDHAYNAIQQEKGNFKLLKQGKQFEVLSTAALSFYSKYDNYLNMQSVISYEDKVAQVYKSNLYRAVDGFKAHCKDVITSKNALITFCNSTFNVDNPNVIENLQRYIESYKTLIGKALDVSIAFEEAFDSGMVAKIEGGIATGEGERLFESAKIYIAKYVYLQYVKGADAFDDCSAQNTYKMLVQIINSNAINFSVEPTQAEINTYNFMRDKLNTFKAGIKNFEVAKAYCNSADKTAEGFASHPYKLFVDSFEQVVMDFASSVEANLIAA